MKTCVKVPVTPGGTNFPHLLERQEGIGGYDCDPWLKLEPTSMVQFFAHQQRLTHEAGQSALHTLQHTEILGLALKE